jgi:hypothetical protein
VTRCAVLVVLMVALMCPRGAHAQSTEGVLDSLMDTQNIPKPLLHEFAKAYEEDWVVFGSGLHQNYFFLPRTIQDTAHGTKTVWGVNLQGADSTDWLSSRAAMIEQQRRRGDPDRYDKYLLTKVQWEVDCSHHRARIVQIIDYDENGNVLWSSRIQGELEEPEHDSNGEGLVRAFCDPGTRITFRDLVNTPLGMPVAGAR